MKQSAKKILKRVNPVKIIVTLIYSEKRPMEKAFTNYLCQQIQKKIDLGLLLSSWHYGGHGLPGHGNSCIMGASDSLLPYWKGGK